MRLPGAERRSRDEIDGKTPHIRYGTDHYRQAECRSLPGCRHIARKCEEDFACRSCPVKGKYCR